MQHSQTNKILLSAVLAMMLISGCSDERATQIAREAADRQAQQNTAMAELHNQVASGTRQLVEADGAARREFAGLHHELQQERTRLDTGWNSLEKERQQMARARRTESMLVPVVTIAGSTVLVALVLGFCWYALVATREGGDTEAELNELLISEVLPNAPPLLTSPQSPNSLLVEPHQCSLE